MPDSEEECNSQDLTHIQAGNFTLFLKRSHFKHICYMLHYFDLTIYKSLSCFLRESEQIKDCIGSPQVRLSVFLTFLYFNPDVIIFERHAVLTEGCSVASAQNQI